MDDADASLRDFTGQQLTALLHSVGLQETTETSVRLLHDALGPAAARPVSESPVWPSDVSDDRTPVEFSTAFGDDDPAVRVLVETIADPPGRAGNLHTSLHVLGALTERFGLSLDRFHAVRDLFLPENPQGAFSLWFSLVFRRGALPAIKVYFNPDVRGVDQGPSLVQEGLRRLGFSAGHSTITAHALSRPGGLDRFSFFALDLDEGDHSRVKVYVSHEDADVAVVERAASAARGVDAERVPDFCLLTGGPGPFTGRPLISSYTFVDDDRDRPSGYSLYVPIRDYVADDAEARTRVLAVLQRCGIDPTGFENALNAVAGRPLTDGAGLIAHVSLRLGRPRPGVTTYLSSEAYGVTAPRPLRLAN
ncbi:tryptophan dimethylallyltransferase family protein [Umezawaea beigongshangensis]|uniref:tryptophan dimethylallyltransferase family protein n=1 Tax=Umezawaea beigongshangensis TaxID=2780383 RepID=UPI0018F234BC|nr:tryptophan dimethylallyltransferase family protein [Umezawaea beigongshangensis]